MGAPRHIVGLSELEDFPGPSPNTFGWGDVGTLYVLQCLQHADQFGCEVHG